MGSVEAHPERAKTFEKFSMPKNRIHPVVVVDIKGFMT